MGTYVSRALTNVTHFARGREVWNQYGNDLWHWFKHATPLVSGGRALTRPDVPGVPNVDEYVALAREICRKVAFGNSAGEVKLREQSRGEHVIRDYLVWFQPHGMMRGLFLVVKDFGDHGEIETMFVPADGRAYFDRQNGQPIQ